MITLSGNTGGGLKLSVAHQASDGRAVSGPSIVGDGLAPFASTIDPEVDGLRWIVLKKASSAAPQPYFAE